MRPSSPKGVISPIYRIYKVDLDNSKKKEKASESLSDCLGNSLIAPPPIHPPAINTTIRDTQYISTTNSPQLPPLLGRNLSFFAYLPDRYF